VGWKSAFSRDRKWFVRCIKRNEITILIAFHEKIWTAYFQFLRRTATWPPVFCFVFPRQSRFYSLIPQQRLLHIFGGEYGYSRESYCPRRSCFLFLFSRWPAFFFVWEKQRTVWWLSGWLSLAYYTKNWNRFSIIFRVMCDTAKCTSDIILRY
jgi:hypothetical protein